MNIYFCIDYPVLQHQHQRSLLLHTVRSIVTAVVVLISIVGGNRVGVYQVSDVVLAEVKGSGREFLRARSSSSGHLYRRLVGERITNIIIIFIRRILMIFFSVEL